MTTLVPDADIRSPTTRVTRRRAPRSDVSPTSRASRRSHRRSQRRRRRPMRRDRASASMHVTITRGGTWLHVDLYHACMQSRALFTVWSLSHLMRQYPGRVPDMDLMFDYMDRSAINRTKHTGDGAASLFDLAPPRALGHRAMEPEFKSIKVARAGEVDGQVPTDSTWRRLRFSLLKNGTNCK
ncbi:hypothetical protein ZWY2020_014168 [Hordeum vulgare]|nr:hypothetical protein ZWY2020_014168 [Hordeum vulgare]